MNYVLVLSDELTLVVDKMIHSVLQHCDCKILFHAISFSDKDKATVEKWNNRIEFYDVIQSKWDDRRMLCRIECLAGTKFSAGDKVFVLDTDMLVQADIFEDLPKGDVYITSRHYPYWYPINGGTVGFNYNKRSKQFIDFRFEQGLNPTWTPYVKFRKKFDRGRGFDWWCDQDMLCTVHENLLPFECHVTDLGPKYNFCPSVEFNIPDSFDKARKEILEAIGRPEYKILHFKGKLKEVLEKEV